MDAPASDQNVEVERGEEKDERIEMSSSENKESSSLYYGVNDVPPWHICIVLGIQHYLTMFSGTVAYPYLLTPYLCMKKDDPARGYIVSTTFFVSGIVTFLQSTFGVRLPIIQGCSIAYLIPTITILSLPEWRCPANASVHSNDTHLLTQFDSEEIWQSRMRLVQGSIACASIFQVIVGFTGLMGFLLRWITPLAITPTIALVGLSLFEEAANYASGNWGICFLTIILLVIFSQYLSGVNIPCCTYRKSNGFSKSSYPLFKLFPVLLTVVFSWLICSILTATEVFSKGDAARTDLRMSTLYESPWFRFPYPGQWGLPTVSAPAVIGFLAAIFSSIVESIGNFYACARLSGAPTPPTHAINRGIFMEGIGCVISAVWGTGSGMTSYSENVGAIGITKVGSRRVVQYGAVVMIVFGFLSKFGTLFMTIPEPIIGGIFCVMFSMVSAVGLSNLQYVDLDSSRNIFVLGISLFLGLCVPKWIQANPGAIKTRIATVDQILTVLLGTSMFVGGFIGLLLDNTISGTDEERGLAEWRGEKNEEKNLTNNNKSCYQLPFGHNFKCPFFSYIPISSSYR